MLLRHPPSRELSFLVPLSSPSSFFSCFPSECTWATSRLPDSLCSDLGASCLVSSTALRLEHWNTGTNSRWLQHQTCVILMDYFTQSKKESLSGIKLIWLFRLKARIIFSYVFSNLSKYSFPSNQWHNKNSRFPNSIAFTRTQIISFFLEERKC